MVDRSLNLLTLHVMWKTRSFTHSTGTDDEKKVAQESVREQRDVLLEKLLEYAIGTQSNALLGVRRAVWSFVFIYPITVNRLAPHRHSRISLLCIHSFPQVPTLLKKVNLRWRL